MAKKEDSAIGFYKTRAIYLGAVGACMWEKADTISIAAIKTNGLISEKTEWQCEKEDIYGFKRPV